MWVIDYPGYGKSGGFIRNEEQLHQVAIEFFEKAEKEYERIVIYGRSIGTGIATRLASEKTASGLIFETPYQSMPALAQDYLPWAPSFLLKYRWLNSL